MERHKLARGEENVPAVVRGIFLHMAEKDQRLDEHTEADTIEESTCVGTTEDTKIAPGSTVPSRTVELSMHEATSLDTVCTPPSSADRLSDEPPRKVPLVPTGGYESDADNSPPVTFDETGGNAGAECPADSDDNDTSDTGTDTQ